MVHLCFFHHSPKTGPRQTNETQTSGLSWIRSVRTTWTRPVKTRNISLCFIVLHMLCLLMFVTLRRSDHVSWSVDAEKQKTLFFIFLQLQTRGVDPGVKLEPGTRTRIKLWRLNSSVQQTTFPVNLLQPSSSSSVVDVSGHRMILLLLLLLLILPLSSLVMTSSLLTVVHHSDRVSADKVCHCLETPDGGMTVRCSGKRLTQVWVWVFVVLHGPGLRTALWGQMLPSVSLVLVRSWFHENLSVDKLEEKWGQYQDLGLKGFLLILTCSGVFLSSGTRRSL